MKVHYSKTYPNLINGTWEKCFLEEDLQTPVDWIHLSDEKVAQVIANVRKLQYALKKQVESFHYESNKADEKKAEIKPKYESPYGNYNTGPEPTIEYQIKSCKEIKVLEGYKLIVKGKPELETIYNNRLKELT